MVVHLIDIRSSASAWLEIFSKIGSEYFWGMEHLRGFFPGNKKKIEKFRNDKNPKLFNMKNDNTRISGLHRRVFSGKNNAI